MRASHLFQEQTESGIVALMMEHLLVKKNHTKFLHKGRGILVYSVNIHGLMYSIRSSSLKNFVI